MNSKSVTIRDVAEAAGVSAMTVTRVFRNECCVSDQTRQRVLENAGKLNYRPNSSARALRGSATRTIGIIASNVGFISQAMRYISIHLMPEEYITCLIDSLGDSKIVHSGLAEISARRMDALIMEYRLDYGDLTELISGQRNPVIFCFHQNLEIEADFCYIDLRAAYRQAIKYLLKSGRKHIYKLGQSLYFFRDVFKEFGIEQNWLNTSKTPSSPNYRNHVELFIDFIENGGKIDAVFCENDLAAAQIIVYLNSKKIQVPGDIAVIGMSNKALSQYLSPALATIDAKEQLLGSTLLKMTENRLKNPDSPFRKAVITPEFILRDSAI